MNDISTVRLRELRGAWLPLFVALAATVTIAGCSDDGTPSTTNGAGGGGVTCLDPSTHADLFTVKDTAFCVVALYEADSISGSPTWGRHGGPLFFAPGAATGSVEITRLTVPAGTTGKLATTKTTIDAQIPMMTFIGAQAIDLPFFDWTAISYTDSNALGELILIAGESVAARYDVNGFYQGVGIGAQGSLGRLLYTGLSTVGDAATKTNGLYAADACGAAGNMPRLVPDGDATCAAPINVAAFGEYSGPMATDRDGNVFAMTSSPTEQEVRGFVADKVARGASPTAGDTLFKLPGYAGSLAAISPDASGIGVVAFQPVDGTTFASLDVVAQHYRVEAGAIVAEGTPDVFLALTTPDTPLPFFTDDEGHLWVAAKRATGHAIAVLARSP
jgi:hypothetical protein